MLESFLKVADFLFKNTYFEEHLRTNASMGPPHSELHYSLSHVGPQHCEKCVFATF